MNDCCAPTSRSTSTESAESDEPAGPPIACSLDGPGQAARISEWSELVALGSPPEIINGGRRLHFPADPELISRLAGLLVREHECCPFVSFSLTVPGGDRAFTGLAGGALAPSVALDACAPAGADSLLDELIGTVGQ